MSEVLETVGVEKSFPSPKGPIKVLNGLDFKVNKGESVSIRGESGAGKTTFLYILSLLEKPDKGTIFWDGERVSDRSSNWLAKRRSTFIGFIFQLFYLIPEIDVLDNVLMPRRIARKLRKEDYERAEQLLVQVGLKDRLRHLSYKLSGGETQRVAIARALINKPSLIIADEPTGSLDEHTSEGIIEMLLQLCKEDKTGVVLVTHNPQFAQLTDRHLNLHYGKIIEG